MDPLHANHAIWIDPLSYDPMVDGPPYLPHQSGGKVASGLRAKQAEEEVMSDLDALLQQGMKKYGDAPMSGLAVLLACIRAESMIHQAHHWQTRGASFYGDHQLFMRVYETTSGFIDGLAERVVGAGDHTLVQPLVQMGLMADFSKLFYKGASAVPESDALPTLSLAAVAKSSILLAMVYDALEEKGLLSGGTDNLLQGIADKQEELVYLLKQRVSTKTARERVASRFAQGV